MEEPNASSQSVSRQQKLSTIAKKTLSTLWGPHPIRVGPSSESAATAVAATTPSTSSPSLLDTESHDGFLEVSVHTLPKPLQREFHHVFPLHDFPPDENAALHLHTGDDNNGSAAKGLHQQPLEFLALPTNQRSRLDLVGTGPAVEAEKDRLLHVFMAYATRLCQTIQDQGYWADFIDPCSGLPMIFQSTTFTRTGSCSGSNSSFISNRRSCSSKVYSEVDGMECCLQYRSYNAGCCKVLLHPKWGSSVYPATIFVRAPRHYIVPLLQDQFDTAPMTTK